MYTIKYRDGYINGYCDKKECTVILGDVQRKFKTLLGAKRWINKALKEPLEAFKLAVLDGTLKR